MRTCFMIILFLFSSFDAISETILLKSGKRLEGEIVSEDSGGVRLREAGGVILHIRSDQIHSRAAAEEGKTSEETVSSADESRKARVYTIEDLARMPQISEVSSIDLPAPAEAAASEPDHESWQTEAGRLRQKREALQAELVEAEANCRQAKEQPVIVPRKAGVVFYDPAAVPPECDTVLKIRERLEEVEEQWNEFTDRARRNGVPWSHLDP